MSAAASFQHHQTARRELSRVLRMLAGFLLGFGLAAWVCFANAAMTGWQYNHRCYADPNEAIEAFKMDYQSIAANINYELCMGSRAPQLVYNTSYTNSAAAFAIQYSFVNESTGGVDSCNSTSRMLGIPQCDPDTQSLAFTGTNALFLVLGYFYAAMLGFKTGYRA